MLERRGTLEVLGDQFFHPGNPVLNGHEHMFVLASGRCNCDSMPPTGSSSSSRSGAARSRPRTPRGTCCGSGTPCRSGSRARCSTRRCRPTRACAGPATSSRSRTRPARRSLLEAGDLRRLRPRDDRPATRDREAVRDRRGARANGLELAERFQTLANPGARLQPAVAALTGLRDAELRRAPPVAAAVAPLPRVRRRRRARRAQRALRHGVPRQRDDAAHRQPRRGDGRRHRRARAPPARPPAGEPRRAARTASRPTRARATARCPTPRRPPRSCSR